MQTNIKLSLMYLKVLFFLLISAIYCPSLLAYENNLQSLKHLKLAKIYLDRGFYDKAESELEAGLKNDPKSPDILNNLGVVCLHLGQDYKKGIKRSNYLEKARNYFTQALDADPNFSSAWNGLADTYYLSGHTQQAISYYKKALLLSPKHTYESHTNLANAQRDLGLLSEAKDNYQRAIDLNPLYAPAHNGYAELLLSQNDLTQAYNEILKAIRLKPNYATAYYHLGLIESARGNKIQALKAYLLSLSCETNSTYAQETQILINKLGLDSNNVSPEELEKFRSELCPPPSTTASEATLPVSAPLYKLDKKSPSLTASNQPNISSVKSLIVNQEWTKSNKEISILLKIHPNDPVLLNESGLVLFNQKKYKNAEKTLALAISKSNGKLVAAYYNLGQVYLAEQNLAKAQNYLEKAKSLAKEQSENYALIDNALAILFKQQNNLEAAQTAYNEAIKISGNKYPVIHYNLAVLLEQLKKPKEAAREFNTYLELSPHGLNAASARRHLKKFSADNSHLGSR